MCICDSVCAFSCRTFAFDVGLLIVKSVAMASLENRNKKQKLTTTTKKRCGNRCWYFFSFVLIKNMESGGRTVRLTPASQVFICSKCSGHMNDVLVVGRPSGRCRRWLCALLLIHCPIISHLKRPHIYSRSFTHIHVYTPCTTRA